MDMWIEIGVAVQIEGIHVIVEMDHAIVIIVFIVIMRQQAKALLHHLVLDGPEVNNPMIQLVMAISPLILHGHHRPESPVQTVTYHN